jgi:hypothetical protein
MKIINESHHNNTISDIFVSFESENEYYKSSIIIIVHVSCLSHEIFFMFFRFPCHFLEFKICGYEGCGPLPQFCQWCLCESVIHK